MKVVVGKLEAAERQLCAAVDLYFRDGDSVAIHTLAAAAHGIVQDVNLARMRAIGERAAPGFENLSVKDIPNALRERGIGAEFAPQVLQRALNEAQNFLKHADHDPLSVLEFDDRWTLLLLYDGCRLYRLLTGKRLPVLSAFENWLFVLEPTGIERSDLPVEMVEEFRNVARLIGKVFSKQEFFDCFVRLPPVYPPSVPAAGMDALKGNRPV